MKQLLAVCLFFQFFSVAVLAQQYKYHIVKDGETVFSISQKYNTTEETIYKYNPDAKRGIFPGSKLVVPLPAKVSKEKIQFKNHKVKRKETLFSLSQKYNVSVANIKRFNKHLYSEELQRGERIRIPINIPSQTTLPRRVKTKSGANPLGISGKEHVVLPKETKYGISRKYNISIDELERLNPHLSVLKPGMVLKVSSPQTLLKKNEKLFKYYQVKPDETLFSLTRRFGISRDSLIVLNPALANGLKIGMVLKIPNREPFGPKEKYSEEDFINLEERISNYDTKNLVLMLPFNSDRIVTTDTSSTAEERLKRDKVMQIALDFYSGVLMAIDSAKTLGLSTHLQVFDTQQSIARINQIIDNNNFRNVDAVIGPLIQAHAEAAAAGLQREDVPVVSPLTKKETRFLDNFYQTRPSQEMLENAMLSFLSKNAPGKNVVIIADASSGAIKSKLLQIMPNARIVNPQEGSYVDQKQLASALVEGRRNWVILESDKINIISNATSYLNSLADKYDITLFTTHKNNSFENDNVSNLHLSKLNLHFPSVDKEYNEQAAATFIAEYKKKYGMVPNTYAVRGFDVTYDVLLRLASAESLAESMEMEGTTEYVENKFDYEQKPSGGYFNKAIYIMAYGDNLELNVVKKDDFKSNLFGQFKD